MHLLLKVKSFEQVIDKKRAFLYHLFAHFSCPHAIFIHSIPYIESFHTNTIQKLPMSEENPEPSQLRNRLYSSLKRHPKRIVFTEGEDVRVLQAAAILVKELIIAPILLGNKTVMKALALEHNIDTMFIHMLDPSTASDLPLFCERLQNIAKYQGKVIADPEELISRPHNFAAMMVQYGQADGIVAGNQTSPSTISRAVTNFIKPLPDVPDIFGVVALTGSHLSHLGKDGILFLADCSITPDPDVEALASIAIESGKLAHHLLGRPVRVAMLSHSTHESMVTTSSMKMKAATALAREKVAEQMLEIEIEGEVSADVALDLAAAEIKLNDAAAYEPADVLVFPNLDAAHIAFKLLVHVAKAKCFGQLLMGVTRHAAQVPMTASVDMITGTAALVACESAKYRELFPEDEG